MSPKDSWVLVVTGIMIVALLVMIAAAVSDGIDW